MVIIYADFSVIFKKIIKKKQNIIYIGQLLKTEHINSQRIILLDFINFRLTI